MTSKRKIIVPVGLVSEGRQFRVSIEFSLEHPEGGIQFVIPKGEGTMAQVSVVLTGFLLFLSAVMHECLVY